MHRPSLPSESIPGTLFCYRLSLSQGHSAVGRIMSMKNSNETIGNRIWDLLTCSAVSQPTAIRRAPSSLPGWQNYDKMGSTCSTNRTRDKRIQLFVWNPERSKQIGKPNNNNMDTRRILNLFIWIWISTSECFSRRW